MEDSEHNHREVEQQPDSGDESANRANHQLHHRVTNFFIDNILRPEFGRRKEAHHDELYLARDTTSVARCGGESIQHRADLTDGEGASKAITVTQDKNNDEGALKSRAMSAGDLSMSSDSDSSQASSTTKKNQQPLLWPAWVYCTRYSDRPSSGRTTHRDHAVQI